MVKIIKKQLVILGIIAVLVTIELSGCVENEKQLLAPANLVLKNVTINPSNPVEKENIYFRLTLENTGDNETPSLTLGLYWTHRDGNVSRSWMNKLFSIDGHSQRNYTLSTGTNNTVAGLQSFRIVYLDYNQSKLDYNQSKEITLTIINITIKTLPPEIYLCLTTNNVRTLEGYTEKKTFNASEIVYIYYEYRNVNHNGVVDINETISVYHQESGVQYYAKNFDEKRFSEVDSWMRYLNISTHDDKGIWPSGRYIVDIGIHDRITGIKTTKTIYFTIV